ncbi:MAG: hypothetical protein J0L94_09525 [Rhodothermia bacterium]|nr:hypothetical protein [Rhodothermia bacterium]
MLHKFTTQLGQFQIRRAIEHRKVQPWPLDPQQRSVLFVVPQEVGAQRSFWQFLDELHLKWRGVFVAILSEQVVFIPPAYIGQALLIKPEDCTSLGLPKKSFLEKVWSRKPDVAIDLSLEANPISALLVGGSSAKYRIGPHHEDAGLYYDLMLDFGQCVQNGQSRIEYLKRHLGQMEPMPLLFRHKTTPFLRPVRMPISN